MRSPAGGLFVFHASAEFVNTTSLVHKRPHYTRKGRPNLLVIPISLLLCASIFFFFLFYFIYNDRQVTGSKLLKCCPRTGTSQGGHPTGTTGTDDDRCLLLSLLLLTSYRSRGNQAETLNTAYLNNFHDHFPC